MASVLASERSTNARGIVSLSAAHFVNDSYVNFVPVLLPYLLAPLNLSLGMIGWVITANTLASSVTQPYFGHLADRWGTRSFTLVGLTLAAVGTAMVALSPNYLALLVLAGIGGFGNAAFHPQATGVVSVLAGRNRGWVMSLYIMCGTLGVASGPILLTTLIDRMGLWSSMLTAAPGVVMVMALLAVMPKPKPSRVHSIHTSMTSTLLRHRAVLTKLVVIVALRSSAFYALLTFIPIYFSKQGAESTGSHLLSILMYASAAGGLIGGYVSDRLARRRFVIVSTLALSAPFVYLVFHTTGIWVWVTTALVGATLLGSFPVLTVKAQELMPKDVAMISGLMLGFSIGIGGIIVGPLGLIAEAISIPSTVNLVVGMPLLGALVAFMLPDRAQEQAAAPEQVSPASSSG